MNLVSHTYVPHWHDAEGKPSPYCCGCYAIFEDQYGEQWAKCNECGFLLWLQREVPHPDLLPLTGEMEFDEWTKKHAPMVSPLLHEPQGQEPSMQIIDDVAPLIVEVCAPANDNEADG